MLHDNGNAYWASDDVTGDPLDVAMVKKARAEVMSYLKSTGVYDNLARSRCYEVTRRKPVPVR